MDDRLRAIERKFVSAPTFENQQALDLERERDGYVQRYVACKRNNERNHPYVKSHGQRVLCDECGGQGWTDVEWVQETVTKCLMIQKD